MSNTFDPLKTTLWIIFLILSLGTAFGFPDKSHAQTYDMPFLADDLKPGERYYRAKKIHTESATHAQHWGYDLKAVRWNYANDRWTSVKVDSDTHWNDPKNSNYIVWGKNVYAVAEGKITDCWRNAPTNPRPKLPNEDKNLIPFEDREWLHQSFRDGLMHFGGNFLQMELSDGTKIRYSHFQKGSIPSSLCPNNAALYSSPETGSSDNDVAPAQQKTVKAGDYLGKVGNVGNSTGPHLHIHREDSGTPKQLKFKRGLASPNTNNFNDINNWTSFAGQRIPPGKTLIWPPRRLVKEYARHKMPAKDFGRMFDHLADSGFWPKQIDGYSVGGRVYYNHVWEPAKGPWRGYYGQTQARFNEKLNENKADGYKPVFIDSYLRNGRVRYSAIYVKNKPGTWRVKSNRTTSAYQVILDQAKADGLKPVTISVVSINGERRYTALFRSDAIGNWKLKSRVRESDYQQVYNKNKAEGRRPIYLNGYVHQGKAYFSVIFATKIGTRVRAKHGASSSGYQAAYENAVGDGYLTQTVTAFDGANSQHRYAAVWRRD